MVESENEELPHGGGSLGGRTASGCCCHFHCCASCSRLSDILGGSGALYFGGSGRAWEE